MSTAANLPEQAYSRPGTVATTNPQHDDGLDAGDILIPRMKLAQKISGVVDNELVEYGAIYVASGSDDMNPQTIAKAAGKGDVGPAVRFYVHGEPRKGWSWVRDDKSLGRGPQYPDLRDVKGQDPRNVRRTYDYLVTLPAYPDMPVRFLMHGQWGGQAAKQINTQLLLNRQRGVETHTVAFKLQARKTSSPQGGQERPFVQAVVGLDKVPAKDKAADAALVESHRALIGASANVSEVPDEAPPARGATATDAPSLD